VISGVAAPPITALMARLPLGPPPMSSITSRKGVPIGASPTPWRWVAPVTMQTDAVAAGTSEFHVRRRRRY